MAVEVYVDDTGSREGRALVMPLPTESKQWDHIVIAAFRGDELPDAEGHFRDDQLAAKCVIHRNDERVSFHYCERHSLIIVKWDGDIREG